MEPSDELRRAAMELRQRIASNIRRLAEKRGMSLNSVADFAGLQRPSLYRILNSEVAVRADSLAWVAHALSVDPTELTRKPQLEH